MTTEAGLERLRASKKTNGEREFAEGVAAGKKWAIERAEYDELARVAAVNDAEYEVGGLDLVAAILNDDKPSQMEWKDTMEEVLGAAEPSDDMVLGFIQGAAEVFDDV